MEFYVGTYVKDTKQTVYKCSVISNIQKNAQPSTHKVNDKSSNNYRINTTPYLDAGAKPSFIAHNNTYTFFYAVNELCMQDDDSYGKIVTLEQKSSDYTQSNKEKNSYQIDTSISTKGDYPCHIAISNDEKLLLVTNYGTGSLQVYSLKDDGNIEALIQTYQCNGSGAHIERQTCAHLHQSLFSPCGSYVFVTDLGCDCIHCFTIGNNVYEPLVFKERVEIPTQFMTSGLGLRHMAFSDSYEYLYVSCELASSVCVCSYEKNTGTLKPLQNYPAFSDLPCYPRTSASEIAYYRNHVYMANRGDDTISVFKAFDDGTLTLLAHVTCGGKTPRHFKIFSDTPFGGDGTLIVANQESNNIGIFKIDGDQLLEIDIVANIPSPSCIL